MPIQRRIFGRNVPPIHPRKLVTLLAAVSLFAVVTLVFTLPNSIPAGPSLSTFTDHKIALPKIPSVARPNTLNPFRPIAHPPKAQKHSTSGDTSWYSNWSWLSPFSSSVTQDVERAVLPPLQERTPIYTYYDHTLKGRAKALKEAENALLLTWRKAWWAQGFNPMIIGPGEAISNPLYKELQMMKLEPALSLELHRWLAWEQMGTGILCQNLLLPMGPREDPLLSYLRRGEYPFLTRFDRLGSGLFTGSKTGITAAVKYVLHNKDLKQAKNCIDALPRETFKVEPKHDSLAYYNPVTVKDRYPKIADRVVDKDIKFTGAVGLQILQQLIEGHLHNTWQNSFPKGIAVVKPYPKHTTQAVASSLDLAQHLSQCPESPIPASCPPNRPRCKPCVDATPMQITTPEFYSNSSDIYTLGTVPHPYTHAVLTSLNEDITLSWIRLNSTRDPWLSKLTEKVLGTKVSGAPRVVQLKNAVASEHGTANSLWLIAEEQVPSDLSWVLGFNLPTNITTSDTTSSDSPPKDQLTQEQMLLDRAIAFGLKSKKESEAKKIRTAMEAWNLADTEAWHFVRAFNARRSMERKAWEDEEGKYAGGAGAEGRRKGRFRWFDD